MTANCAQSAPDGVSSGSNESVSSQSSNASASSSTPETGDNSLGLTIGSLVDSVGCGGSSGVRLPSRTGSAYVTLPLYCSGCRGPGLCRMGAAGEAGRHPGRQCEVNERICCTAAHAILHADAQRLSAGQRLQSHKSQAACRGTRVNSQQAQRGGPAGRPLVRIGGNRRRGPGRSLLIGLDRQRPSLIIPTEHVPGFSPLDSGALTAASTCLRRSCPSMASWLNLGAFSSGGDAKAAPKTCEAQKEEDGPAECLSVTNRKAKAVYPCEAEHDSELSFDVGAIFDDVIFSREPGWLEGELEGRRGLIPENYVEML
ncbi:hypothetical protein Z043_115917 [Scleropages formosus]|uniref:SH3 domain-containing protein n=1 Tax=Scleropages formosus TaxID=113540 RepID=A0A0P7TWI3_SCLFO|nr:hypothetical protein Z043_115917 [Scleropages formosus]